MFWNKKLTKKDIEKIPKSYDSLGDLLIFADFPSELKKKEKLVAKYILKEKRHVKVVLKKVENYSGVFRTPKLKIIGGEKRKETIHKENGVYLKLNPEEVYFSSRSSTERKRIYQQVKPGENILVMFSGAGPLPLMLAKNTAAKEIYGVEINPKGHEYALMNVKLNKLQNVKLFCGDVTDILPTFKKKFDRILMPLPKDAHSFLYLALSKIKKNGTIHLYDFVAEENISTETKTKIDLVCKTEKKRYKLLRVVKCGQYGSRRFRVCADFIVE